MVPGCLDAVHQKGEDQGPGRPEDIHKAGDRRALIQVDRRSIARSPAREVLPHGPEADDGDLHGEHRA